jgi:hypothetical protein
MTRIIKLTNICGILNMFNLWMPWVLKLTSIHGILEALNLFDEQDNKID